MTNHCRYLAALCAYALTCAALAVQPVAPPPPPPTKTLPVDGNIETLCPRPPPGLYKGTCDARMSNSAEGSRVAFDEWVGCRMQYAANPTSIAALHAREIRPGWEREADHYLARLKELIPEKDWQLAVSTHTASVARRPSQEAQIHRLYEGKEPAEARAMAATSYAVLLRADALELGCMVEIASRR